MLSSRFIKIVFIFSFLMAINAIGAQKLNNFVTQLVLENIASPSQEYTASPLRIFSISLTRNNWVYVDFPEAKCDPGEKIIVTVDDGSLNQAIISINSESTVFDRMEYLSSGSHQIKIWTSGSPIIGQIKVNSIPEIIYYQAEFCSSIQQLYSNLNYDFIINRDWSYLKQKRLLDFYNVICCRSIVGDNYSGCIVGDYADAINEWHSMGRKWVMGGSIGWGLTAEQVYNQWKSYLLLSGVDGIMLDEFSGAASQAAEYPKFVQAAQMISNDSQLSGKQIYAFTGGVWHDEYDVLLEGFTALGYRFCPEFYLNEQATETNADNYITSWLKNQMQLFKNNIPGCINNAVVTLGPDNMATRFSWDKYPQVNFKNFLDKQFYMLANNSTFDGVYGINFWAAHYVDEEIMKWFNSLIKHYCIEGNTTMLGEYSYILNHISNPGFESGLDGWSISEASSGSVIAYDSTNLPFTGQLNYPSVPEHSKVLLTTRSVVKPNLIRQSITNLAPCSLYVAKVYSCDLTDFQTEKDSGVSVKINNAKVINRKTVHEYYQYPDRYLSTASGNTIPVAWTSDIIIFQANSSSAEIVLSDWPSNSIGTANIGNQIVWDFIQIEPYYYAPACRKTKR